MTLYEYDKSLNIPLFCGVDEAGRGPLAGDVYAAAVILPLDFELQGINDSKKLSEKKREALFDVICENAVAWSIGVATVEEIERYNILQATFLAMRRAVEGLSVTPSFALIDGDKNPDLGVPSRCLVKGDATSASIAAASILAKVARDRYMLRMAEKYPEYQFEKHKGYGTKLHTELICTLGASPIHRESFLKKIFQKAGKTPFLSDGARGEAVASQLLSSKGYLLRKVNYHSPYGEIDIIAEKDGVLAFVEVKTRSDDAIYSPAEAVTLKKQLKICKTAATYLQEEGAALQPRFDIIEVVFLKNGGDFLSADHIEDAFPFTEEQ